jgi:hypothetical protein
VTKNTKKGNVQLSEEELRKVAGGSSDKRRDKFQ